MELRLFDTLLEPTFVINKDFQVLYCNEAAALLAEVSVRKIQRQKPKLIDLFSFSIEVPALAQLETLQEASPYQEVGIERVNSLSTGRVQVAVQPAQLGFNEVTWIIFMRDVTLEEALQRKYRSELSQKESYIAELEAAKEQLADYNRNLELKVAQRTSELAHANQMMKALMDSLGQGFFIFNEQGRVLDIATKACLDTIEMDPRGKLIFEVLKLNEKEANSFSKWMQTLFSEMLPFEDLAPLGPDRYQHQHGHYVELKYHALRDEQNMIGVVVVATDITDLVKAREEAQQERAYAQLVLKLTQNKKQFGMFYQEAKSLISDLKFIAGQSDHSSEELLRALHTLKGGAASFSLIKLANACHEAENVLANLNLKSSQGRLQFTEIVNEIEQEFEHFNQQFDDFLRFDEQNPHHRYLLFAQRFLKDQPAILEQFYLEFLLEPISQNLSGLNQAWLEAAAELGKKVQSIQFEQLDFLIWSTPYQNLFSTLIHVVRNSADHGIELPQHRLLAGKSEFGQLTIRVEKKNHGFRLIFQDDGKGIDPQIIRAKLKSKGCVEAAQLGDQEVIQHIFDAQFSTQEQVTHFSGRGVGMDAVKAATQNLGGQVWVESTPGHGMKLIFELPFLWPEMIDPKLQIA